MGIALIATASAPTASAQPADDGEFTVVDSPTRFPPCTGEPPPPPPYPRFDEAGQVIPVTFTEIVADAVIVAAFQRLAAGEVASCDVNRFAWVAQAAPDILSDLVGEWRPTFDALFQPHGGRSRPLTPFERAVGAFRDGDSSEGNRLFDLAIARATSDTQKSNFYALRASRGYGDQVTLVRQCLEHNPLNAHCLFMRAGLAGDTVGRPTTTEGRAAYWCMADMYSKIAEVSTSESIASSARRATVQYERAAPSASESLEKGWTVGQRITAPFGAGTCTTTVRLPPPRGAPRR